MIPAGHVPAEAGLHVECALARNLELEAGAGIEGPEPVLAGNAFTLF